MWILFYWFIFIRISPAPSITLYSNNACLPRVKDYVFLDCFVSILLTLKSTLLSIGFWYEVHAKGYFFWTFV